MSPWNLGKSEHTDNRQQSHPTTRTHYPVDFLNKSIDQSDELNTRPTGRLQKTSRETRRQMSSSAFSHARGLWENRGINGASPASVRFR